jgi:hypothetical protein
MNHALPRQRVPLPALCQRVAFDASWYGTPSARRSSGVRPPGVKWKTYSWQSLTKRSLLIGL